MDTKKKNKSIYIKIIMKSNYKNEQNELRDNYANWFMQKLVFKKFQRILFKK